MIDLKLILLIIAVSLDSSTVGFSYGLQGIRLSIRAFFIIIVCSFTVVIISMTIGHMIRLVVPLHLTETIGSILLILIGLYLLVSVYIKAPSSPKRQLSTYLKHPEKVDFDQSRSISIYEALFLGLALSIDAFGAGIAASLLHYHLLSTASLAALMTGAFLFFSMKIGLYLSQFHLMSRLTFLPPLLIMSIGLYHFFS